MTGFGANVTDLTVMGRTVIFRVSVCAPLTASMSPTALASTGVGVIWNEAAVLPAGTTTLAGTDADGFSLERSMESPPGGAFVVKVTFPAIGPHACALLVKLSAFNHFGVAT